MTALPFDPDVESGHYVYYCYAADGTLIYVGCSRGPENRVDLHNRWTGSYWMVKYCTEVVVGDVMARVDAFALEAAEIETHGPVFNRLHNPNPQQWEPVAGKPVFDPPTLRYITPELVAS